MSVKVYKITGHYKKGKQRIKFSKFVRALNPQDALENIYAIMGSKHHVKRTEIVLTEDSIREITDPNEITDQYVHTFTTDDNLKIPKKA
ncbi:MAG: 50S ribosomal protein L18a [Candidatus Heimdallarchaeum aukensis]|uniref:Large ribosomal subunit protein eL20 n=1 Tax=Candidatus Heimdallarchaeum aukensis TaxID=2876573 RepID=A0A9Y1BJ61_9ARCH|nr:MAG: 50S ribosomal protein L18a [Candidatus Pacearchaeota archaeon]UJG40014.1 MAG: 50S ribosomal protein L18a [Candidatus Heimdallarchaeum aukensis]